MITITYYNNSCFQNKKLHIKLIPAVKLKKLKEIIVGKGGGGENVHFSQLSDFF